MTQKQEDNRRGAKETFLPADEAMPGTYPPLCNDQMRRQRSSTKPKTGLHSFPLNPATPGHTLIIPRTHVTDFWSVELPLDAKLMAATIRLGQAIEAALRSEGMNLTISAGETAEQTVFHLHLHVVPRWKADGFGKIWPVEDKHEDADLSDADTRIREAFEGLPP